MESLSNRMTTLNSMSTASTTAPSDAASSPIDMHDLLAPVLEEMKLVEEWLTTNLIDESPFVGELLNQIFQAGGKRIRPLVTLLASKASLTDPAVDQVHSEISRLHIILAVLTELIHSASLVHDDVIDASSTRRGQETVNKKFNDKLAVLLGDLLFAQASICLARIMNPVVVGIYGQVLGDLCSGEISQMRQQFSTVVDWDAYFQKSIKKTASLIAAGAHSGAILNARPNEVVAALKVYGEKLGLCFQIVDDVLDFTGTTEATGKPVGGDLRGGLITAPALYILEAGGAPAVTLAKLIKDRQVQTDEGVAEALELIRSNGGVEAALALAARIGEEAKAALSILPDSPSKASLIGLVDYVLVRNK
ncbi:MAG: polyprenyl synthetase family protein [Cyanobacteria bacterium REEB67]|nr:polyprenyl synthetase family protein [Cyanobacteria bacterium REEB67]